MSVSRAHLSQPSARIRDTGAAIIDDIINEYGDRVRFNLAPGSTYFGPSSEIITQVIAKLDDPRRRSEVSRYGDVLGVPELRKLWSHVLIAGYDDRDGQIRGDSVNDSKRTISGEGLLPNHELMITAGANQGFVNAVLTVCDEGDEVLLILPYYFSHFNALVMTGVVPVLVPVHENTFEPQITSIEERISKKSKALVVVNPGNPSGRVFSKEVMNNIVALCKHHGIWLIIDEAYREFVHEGESRIAYSPKLDDGIIYLYTASKAYGLAGWRIGAVLYPERLSESMRKVQDTIATHASRFSQEVAFEALHHDPLYETAGNPSRITLLNRVREIFTDTLRPIYRDTSLSDRLVIPDGAFYFFLPYRDSSAQCAASVSNDMEVVKFLAVDHGVLLTPGFVFGMPGYVRLSYGCIEISDAPEAANRVATGMRYLLER